MVAQIKKDVKAIIIIIADFKKKEEGIIIITIKIKIDKSREATSRKEITFYSKINQWRLECRFESSSKEIINKKC